MLIAVLCEHCGVAAGSGSSGFDISPVSEAQAVARAIDHQQCVDFHLQTFCASGVQPEARHVRGRVGDHPAAARRPPGV